MENRPLAPTDARQRLESLDVLRGIAVLGILVMNIRLFALPQAACMNPLALGEPAGIDRLAYWSPARYRRWAVLGLALGLPAVALGLWLNERDGWDYASIFFVHGQLNYRGGFVVAVWNMLLLAAPWWLARFRFGPLEWLWRSLTYWRWQPLRPPSGQPEETNSG